MNSAEVRLFFEDLAFHWDEGFTTEHHFQLKSIFRYQIPALPPPILDLGSGTGVLVPYLQDKMNAPGNIVQFDVARQMLTKARRKLSAKNGLYFVQGDALRLPFAAAAFGTVFCFQIVPHVADKYALLQEVRRILRPGGYIAVLHLMDHRRLNALHRRLSPPVHTHHMCPAEELAATMIACGLDILQVTEEEDLYLVMASAPGS